MSSIQIRHILTMATLGASLSVFAACNRSDADESAQKASKASNEAARITETAGDFRPAPSYINKVKVTTPEDLNKALTEIQVAFEAGKAVDPADPKHVWHQFLQQKSVDGDLKDASDRLTKVVAEPELQAGYKSLVQAQNASVAALSTQNLLNTFQDRLFDLVTRTTDIQMLSLRIHSLTSQAGTNDKKAAGLNGADAVAAAGGEFDKAKSEAASRASDVQKLETEIAQKKAKAAEIYGQTENEMNAADRASGVESIEAMRRAVEARKEADKLTAEVANLLPLLSEAKLEFTVAQIKQKEAESALNTLTHGQGLNDSRIKQGTDQATDLRQQAKRLIEDEKFGLALQLKEFNTRASELEKDLVAVNSSASNSVKLYGEAISQLSIYQKAVNDRVPPPKEGRDKDPLLKVVNNPNLKAMLLLHEASSRQQAGRVNVVGYFTAGMSKTVNEAASRAYQESGLKFEGAIDAEKAKTYAENADKEFQAAIVFVNSATIIPGIGENSPIRWLGSSIQSAAHEGIFLVTGREDAKKSAVSAAKDAYVRNPGMQVNNIIGAQ